MTDTPESPEPHSAPGTEPSLPRWSSTLRVVALLAAVAWLVWATGWWGLVIALGLVAMIALHELGHYLMAKRAGMKVTEFFIGFGPRIWSFRRGETEYGIKAIPAGAYVRIIGMNSVEEVDPADEARTYRAQPFWQRFGVAVAGSTMHYLQAFVLVFILLVGFGQPGGTWLSGAADDHVYAVGSVYANCPGAQAGFRADDELVSVAGVPITEDTTIRTQLAGKGDQQVPFVVRRDGELLTLTPTLLPVVNDGQPTGLLGISYGLTSPPDERLGPIEAIPQTVHDLGFVTVESVKGIVNLFSFSSLKSYSSQVINAHETTPTAPSTTAPVRDAVVPPSGEDVPAEDLVVSPDKCAAAMATGDFTSGTGSDDDLAESRPVSILGIFQLGTSAGESLGVPAVLGIFALINVFIGVFNLTPILPFDGGHVVIALYEKFQERRKGLRHRYFANLERMLPVVYAVVAVLGLIFVSSLYLDVNSPLSVK